MVAARSLIFGTGEETHHFCTYWRPVILAVRNPPQSYFVSECCLIAGFYKFLPVVFGSEMQIQRNLQNSVHCAAE